MSRRVFNEKQRLLALMVSINEARSAMFERLIASLPDGSEIRQAPDGRRWRVWTGEHGEREASPLEEG